MWVIAESGTAVEIEGTLRVEEREGKRWIVIVSGTYILRTGTEVDCKAYIAELVDRLNAPDRIPTEDEVHAMSVFIEWRKYSEKQPDPAKFDYEVVRQRLANLENAVSILRARGVLLEDVR